MESISPILRSRLLPLDEPKDIQHSTTVTKDSYNTSSFSFTYAPTSNVLGLFDGLFNKVLIVAVLYGGYKIIMKDNLLDGLIDFLIYLK